MSEGGVDKLSGVNVKTFDLLSVVLTAEVFDCGSSGENGKSEDGEEFHLVGLFLTLLLSLHNSRPLSTP